MKPYSRYFSSIITWYVFSFYGVISFYFLSISFLYFVLTFFIFDWNRNLNSDLFDNLATESIPLSVLSLLLELERKFEYCFSFNHWMYSTTLIILMKATLNYFNNKKKWTKSERAKKKKRTNWLNKHLNPPSRSENHDFQTNIPFSLDIRQHSLEFKLK